MSALSRALLHQEKQHKYVSKQVSIMLKILEDFAGKTESSSAASQMGGSAGAGTALNAGIGGSLGGEPSSATHTSSGTDLVQLLLWPR